MSKLLKRCTFKTVPLSKYRYKKIAVDISPFLFKYRIIFQEAWLKSFVNLVCCLRRNDIHPVFIYDGNAPVEKNAEKDSRRASRDKIKEKASLLEIALENYEKTGDIDPILTSTGNVRLLDAGIDKAGILSSIDKYRKQSTNISHDDKEDTKRLLENLGTPYIKAPEEAEKFASELYKAGLVDAVLSDDTDVLAYGAIMLSKIDTKTCTCVEIKPKHLLKQLELTAEQFKDLCILMGTDYNKNIKNIGPEKSYKLIKQYGSIEGIRDATNIDVSVLNFVRVRELFTLGNVSVDIPYCKQPELRELGDYNISFISKDMVENDKIVFID